MELPQSSAGVPGAANDHGVVQFLVSGVVGHGAEGALDAALEDDSSVGEVDAVRKARVQWAIAELELAGSQLLAPVRHEERVLAVVPGGEHTQASVGPEGASTDLHAPHIPRVLCAEVADGGELVAASTAEVTRGDREKEGSLEQGRPEGVRRSGAYGIHRVCMLAGHTKIVHVWFSMSLGVNGRKFD